MARKRMFDSEIINKDDFMDLPMEAKALYFLLGMEADDEGFVSYRKILRLYGGNEDSIKLLAIKNFIIMFQSGVIVITDWKRNNYLDKNRMKPTIYQEEKSKLFFNETLQQYVLNECLTDVKQMLNQNSIEENSIEENSIEENSIVVVEEEEKEQLQKLFIKCTSSTNLNAIEECLSYLDDFPYEVIEVALKKTSEKNGGWKYAKTILQNWLKAGIKTIEQIQSEEINFKNKKMSEEQSKEKLQERIERAKKRMEEQKNGGKRNL